MENQDKIKEWENKNKPYKIIDNRIYVILKLSVIILLIILITCFVYLGVNDKFKSYTDCGNTTLVCEGIVIPECPECPKCPTTVCDVSCPDFEFPDDLTIKLKNSS